MKPQTYFLFLIITTFWSVKGTCQWVNYSLANTQGIQANSIRAIQEDPEGRVWFATENGLYKRDFNTGTWDHFDTSDGLSSDNVNNIFITTTTGNVLGLTANGLCRFSGGNFVEIAQEVTFPVITSATGPDPTELWITTLGGGIARLLNGNYTYHSTATGLPTNFYKCAFTDVDGTVWFGSSNHGIIKYSNAEGWVQYTIADGLAGNTVQDICIDSNGQLWLAGSNGLSRLIGGQWQPFTSNEGASSSNYFDLSVAPNGAIWAGGDNGIDIFEGGVLVSHIGMDDGLNADYVTAICHDSHDIVWVGHAQNGTSALIDGTWHDYSDLSGLNPPIHSMAEDNSGIRYFAGYSGMTVFDGINWRHYETGIDFPYTGLRRVFSDSDGSIRLCFTNGNAKLTGGNWTFSQNPQSLYAMDMLVDLDGSKWFLSYNKVHRQSPTGQLTIYNNDFFFGSSPSEFTIDEHGKIWVLNRKGLFAFSNDTWQSHLFENPENYLYVCDDLTISPEGYPTFGISHSQWTPDGYVRRWVIHDLKNGIFRERHTVELQSSATLNDIYFDSETNLWLSTSNYNIGFVRIDPNGNQTKRYESEGFLSNRIYSTFEDSEGYFWLLSGSGVSKAPFATVDITEEGFDFSHSMVAYPNPTYGRFSVEFIPKEKDAVFQIHDLSGKLIVELEYNSTPNSLNRLDFDLSNVPSGVYLISSLRQNMAPTKIVINKLVP